MKRTRTRLPATYAALNAMGAQIAIARRELGWSAVELAERLGTTAALVTRIEKGAPGTAIGTVFEAAVICGVPLFGTGPGTGPERLPEVAEQARTRLALLPQRVAARRVEVDDDF